MRNAHCRTWNRADNANGLLLTGNISYFDGKRMYDIVMLKINLKDEEVDEP